MNNLEEYHRKDFFAIKDKLNNNLAPTPAIKEDKIKDVKMAPIEETIISNE